MVNDDGTQENVKSAEQLRAEAVANWKRDRQEQDAKFSKDALGTPDGSTATSNKLPGFLKKLIGRAK